MRMLEVQNLMNSHTRRYAATVIIVGLGCASFVGCAAKIPAGAVQLSRIVGQQISVVQASHEMAVAYYFDLSRERVEDFLVQQWIPVFLENFVPDSALLEKLQSPKPFDDARVDRLRQELVGVGLNGDELTRVVGAVESAFGDATRGREILQFAEAAVGEIETQRRALVEPLSNQEQVALTALRATYAQLLEAQVTITAHLESAREVQVQQDLLLQRFNLLEQRDSLVRDAIDFNETVMGVIDRGGDAAGILDRLRTLVAGTSSDGEEESPADQP